MKGGLKRSALDLNESTEPAPKKRKLEDLPTSETISKDLIAFYLGRVCDAFALKNRSAVGLFIPILEIPWVRSVLIPALRDHGLHAWTESKEATTKSCICSEYFCEHISDAILRVSLVKIDYDPSSDGLSHLFLFDAA
jgi:hypothetical protein